MTKGKTQFPQLPVLLVVDVVVELLESVVVELLLSVVVGTLYCMEVMLLFHPSAGAGQVFRSGICSVSQSTTCDNST